MLRQPSGLSGATSNSSSSSAAAAGFTQMQPPQKRARTALPSKADIEKEIMETEEKVRSIETDLDQQITKLTSEKVKLEQEIEKLRQKADALAEQLPKEINPGKKTTFKSPIPQINFESGNPKMFLLLEIYKEVESLKSEIRGYQRLCVDRSKLVAEEKQKEAERKQLAELQAQLAQQQAYLAHLKRDQVLFFSQLNSPAASSSSSASAAAPAPNKS